MTNIYVGNLLYATTEPELVEFFGAWGAVERATLVYDRETGRPRGFAFVEMPEREEALRAIEAAHGAELNGRPLTVNEARPRGSGGGGGAGGGGASRPAPAATPARPGTGHGGAGAPVAEVTASAGYGNAGRTNSATNAATNPAPPAEDLPKDDPAAVPAADLAPEPVRKSGGYTNHVLR